MIDAKIPNLDINKINKKDLREVYQILNKERLWLDLPLNELNPLIRTKDVADFFFYYWLAHNQILKKNKILQFYISVTT